MKNTIFLPTRPATPEDVLAVFRDGYRFQLEYDPEAEPGHEIDFEMTVRDWTNACDLLRPSKLGAALSEEFGIKASRMDWQDVLKPPKKRTLKDVCEFISARGGRVSSIEKFQIFGSSCDTAGAFLSIRSMLDERGISVTRLRPSSSVTDFIKNNKQHGALLNTMHHLAPGILPDPVQYKESRVLDNVAVLIMLSGFLVGLISVLVWAGNSISGYLGGPAIANSTMEGIKGWIVGIGVTSFITGFLGFSISEEIWPTRHSHPPVETFGDLARAVAAYEAPTSSA